MYESGKMPGTMKPPSRENGGEGIDEATGDSWKTFGNGITIRHTSPRGGAEERYFISTGAGNDLKFYLPPDVPASVIPDGARSRIAMTLDDQLTNDLYDITKTVPVTMRVTPAAMGSLMHGLVMTNYSRDVVLTAAGREDLFRDLSEKAFMDQSKEVISK